MTYNFDPDKWYDIERELLEARLGKGEISEQVFKSAVEALDRRYDEMLDRLDGSYQIPK
jgi:hypothetical protein